MQLAVCLEEDAVGLQVEVPGSVSAIQLHQHFPVFDVQPGLIETDMTKAVSETYRRRIEDEGLTLIPRLGKPADMGRIVATLATGGLPYMTGQVLAADAGMLVPRF